MLLLQLLIKVSCFIKSWCNYSSTVLTYKTEAFLSYCMTDMKTTAHRSEHLRVDKFVSFIPVSIYISTLITLPLLFQFAKRNEKVMLPPVCIKFCIQTPSLLLSFSPMPLPPPIFQPPLPGNYCTVPKRRTLYEDITKDLSKRLRTHESPRELARQSEAKRKQAPQSEANVCRRRRQMQSRKNLPY